MPGLQRSVARFNNKTNGYAAALDLHANPGLSKILSRIGSGWIDELPQISRLRDFATTQTRSDELVRIKRANKESRFVIGERAGTFHPIR